MILASRPSRISIFRGLTLIEILAVLVIVTAATAMLTVNASAMDDHATAMHTLATVRTMDARARLLTRSSGQPIVLHWDQEERLLSMRPADKFEEVIETRRLDSLGIRIEEATVESTSILIDAAGRSTDYFAEVRTNSGTRELRVAGLTGLIYEEAIEP